jgi:hypothetical protein
MEGSPRTAGNERRGSSVVARLRVILFGLLAGGALVCAAGAAQAAPGALVFTDATGHTTYTAPSDASLPPTLLPLGGLEPWGAHYSPDGTRLVYEDFFVLKTAAADGTDQHTVLDLHERGGLVTTPRWSPDGRFLYFIYNPSRDRPAVMSRGIYRVGVDGSGLTRVSQRGSFSDFDVSPDGKQLVMDGEVKHQLGTWVKRIGRGKPMLLFDALTGGLDWAQPGAITYSGGSTMSEIAPDGSGDHVIFWHPGSWLLDPAWSPDGTRLAFASGPDAYHAHVVVTDPDGSNAVQITTTPSLYRWIDWQP